MNKPPVSIFLTLDKGHQRVCSRVRTYPSIRLFSLKAPYEITTNTAAEISIPNRKNIQQRSLNQSCPKLVKMYTKAFVKLTFSKNSIFFFAIITFCIPLFGQSSNQHGIDSLHQVMKTNPHDSLKMQIFDQLTKMGDLQFAIHQTRQALKLANNSYPHEIPRLHINLATLYYRALDLDSLKWWLDKYAETEITKNTETKFMSHLLRGHQFLGNGNNSNALVEYQQAGHLAQKNGMDTLLLDVYCNIAHIHCSAPNFEEAYKYIDLAKPIAIKDNSLGALAYLETLKGELLHDEKKFQAALNQFLKAEKLYIKLGHPKQLSHVYNNISQVMLALQRVNEGKGFALKSIEQAKKMGFKGNWMLAFGYLNYANISIGTSNPKDLLLYADTANRIAKGSESAPYLYHDLYEVKYQLFKEAGISDSALLYHEKFQFLKDSLRDIKDQKGIADLESKYQLQVKENEVELLQANARYNTIVFYGTFILIFLIAIFIVTAIYRKYQNASKLRRKFQEIDQIKSRFLINLSHELRTPLSLIINPLERQIEKTKAISKNENLQIIKRNAMRLKNMINQLLDLAKIDSGNIKLQVEETNLSTLLKKVAAYFTHEAEAKHIDYQIIGAGENRVGFVDPDMIEKIITNLLYNAFKFTSDHGSIRLSCTFVNTHLTISVIDNGIGIPKNKLDNIFNPFYQVDNSSVRKFDGTGIGLSICKELAEAHKGKLTVESTPDKGSTFTLKVPLEKSFYNQDEIKALEIKSTALFTNPTASNDLGKISIPTQKEHAEKPWIVIAEDNMDMQFFLKTNFEEQYQIATASDGEKAWDRILSLIPSLVLCDIMMPKVNGNRLCKKIKEHPLTKHIPVVILTAKTDNNSYLDGLENGADAYFTKPFDNKALMLTISNLIQLSQHTPTYGKSTIAPENISETRFFEELMTIIKDHHGDYDFGIDQLVSLLGLSRSQLQRRTKSLTGYAPGELIRNYRMDRAKRLLLVKNTSVSEVAHQLGHRNMSNFAKMFKEYTGLTPSEYIASHAIASQEEEII